MFGLSEVGIIIIIITLLLIVPSQLPKMLKNLAQTITELRKARKELNENG